MVDVLVDVAVVDGVVVVVGPRVVEVLGVVVDVGPLTVTVVWAPLEETCRPVCVFVPPALAVLV